MKKIFLFFAIFFFCSVLSAEEAAAAGHPGEWLFTPRNKPGMFVRAMNIKP